MYLQQSSCVLLTIYEDSPQHTHTHRHTQLGTAFRCFLNYFRVWVTWLLTQPSDVLTWSSLTAVVSKHPSAAEWSKKKSPSTTYWTTTCQIYSHSISTSIMMLNLNLESCAIVLPASLILLLKMHDCDILLPIHSHTVTHYTHFCACPAVTFEVTLTAINLCHCSCACTPSKSSRFPVFPRVSCDFFPFFWMF